MLFSLIRISLIILLYITISYNTFNAENFHHFLQISEDLFNNHNKLFLIFIFYGFIVLKGSIVYKYMIIIIINIQSGYIVTKIISVALCMYTKVL